MNMNELNHDLYATQLKVDPYLGKIFGNCKTIQKIGEGGSAIVYLAHHEFLDVRRVIKILRPGLIHYENFKKRLLREAKIVARLDHPNIVRVFNTGEQDEIAFIEMEYVEGETLREILLRENRIDQEKSIKIISQIAHALDHAHQMTFGSENKKGIIHRDIKPENIMISKTGEAKLMDFGIAKPNEATSETVPGSVIGTYAYMSPEQIEGKEIDFKTDIYSLAVVFFEMISGGLPYEGKTITKLAMEISSGNLKFPSNAGLNKSVREILEKALNSNPENRYKTTIDFSKSLKNAIQRKDDKVVYFSFNNKAKIGSLIVLVCVFSSLVIYFNTKKSSGAASNNKASSFHSKATLSLSADSNAVKPPAIISESGKSDMKSDEDSIKKPVNVIPKKDEKAIKQIKTTAIKSKENYSFLGKGKEYEKAGEWQKAIDEFSRVKSPAEKGIEEEYIEARVRLSKIQMNALGNTESVISDLIRLNSYFSYYDIANLLGQCYIRKMDFVHAKDVLEKCLSKRNKCLPFSNCDLVKIEIYFNLGVALENLLLVKDDIPSRQKAVDTWKKVQNLSCSGNYLKYCKESENHLKKINLF
jgi:serine/threonine protein kinase